MRKVTVPMPMPAATDCRRIVPGVGTGAWGSVEEACRATIKQTKKLNPNKKAAALYERHYATYGKLYFDLKDRFEEIAKLNA